MRPTWLFLTLTLAGCLAWGLLHVLTSDESGRFVEIGSTFLLGFLVILIVRYGFLVWHSYLDHMERLFRAESTDTPFVSIIVPALNEEKTIEKTIENLLALDYPRYEVIVVDDGSVDRTHAHARRWEDTGGRVCVRVLRQPNRGKSAALNAGIRHAEGAIVFCMDADSRLAPDTLRLAVRHFADPTVGAVAGHVRVLNRKNFWTALQALEYLEGLTLVRRSLGFFRMVNIIPGPCGAFRKDVLEEVGMYQADTFAEDCDVTMRILEKGWKIVYEPHAIAFTEAPETLLDLLGQRYRWTRGVVQALTKNAPGMIRSSQKFPGNLFVVIYMAFEGIFWPIANILAHATLLSIVVVWGFTPLMVLWWAQLLIFNTMVTMYCVTLEREDIRLVFAAFLYHTFFIIVMDIGKVFSMCEEIIDIKMRWGRVTRVGYQEA